MYWLRLLTESVKIRAKPRKIFKFSNRQGDDHVKSLFLNWVNLHVYFPKFKVFSFLQKKILI